MTAVPEKVLNWLYSVLTSEYRDVNRTFSDVSQLLAEYPSLSPRTEVYTYENGASALLLRLSGNLPVWFRGAMYKFPILLWVPHAYPHESPITYVTSSEGLAVRPGQHVSVEGRIYHPCLAQWGQHWDTYSLVHLLRVLQDVFSKEPPLRSISQGQHGAAVAQQVPPPTPPTNNSARPGSFSRGSPRAPPPPPKPHEGQMNSPRTESGPSLPPLPPKQQNNPNNQFSGTPQGSPYGQQEPFRNGHIHGQQDLHAPSGAPPPPPKPYQSQQPPAPQANPESARFSRYGQPPPLPPQSQSSGQPRQAQWPSSGAPPIQYTNYPPPQQQQYPPPQQHPSYNQPPPQPPVAQPPQPVPDLLSSSLEATLPSQHPATTNTSTTPLPAPPIPPNPEKDALLSALSQVLHSHLNTTVAQTRAAAEPLRAQHAALRQAHATLTAELRQLQELDGALAANERMLAEGMREAERVTAEARQRAVPGVDEVLVAPTVVGSQLWGLCAEEVGIAEAMYALGRGLDAGRVGAETFVKQTRALARERFLKKALIKKIARGMGLDMDN